MLYRHIRKIVQKCSYILKKVNVLIQVYKKHEKVSALFRRELKRYFSTPVYLLNTMLGRFSCFIETLFWPQN